MVVIQGIDSIDCEKWHCLLQDSKCASVFQNPDFFHHNNHIDGMSADVFVVEKDNYYVASVVVQRFFQPGILKPFTSRAIIQGGIVLHPQLGQTALAVLLPFLKQYYSHKVVYLEQRSYFNYDDYNAAFIYSNFAFLPWSNFQIQLHNISDPIRLLGANRKRQLRKSLSLGVVWAEVDTGVDFDAFFSLLFDFYSQKLRKPLPPKVFFVNLLISDLAKCIVVKKNNQVLGGVFILLSDSNKTIYEYYRCGLDREYPGCHPSIVGIWGMMQLAQKIGYKTIDLMGAGAAHKPSSIRDFKSKFGGDQVNHGRYIYVFQPVIYKVASFYFKCISKF